MKKIIVNIFLILIIEFVYNTVYSQKKLELEKIKTEKKTEIKKIENLLNLTIQDKIVSINKVELLSKKISTRNGLIDDLYVEILNSDNKINALNKEINSNDEEIEKIKGQYSRIIYSSYYKLKNYNRILFILSSNSFNQAYRRFYFLKQYSNKRKILINNLIIKVLESRGKLNKLIDENENKKELLIEKENETIKLNNDKESLKNFVNECNKKEKKLKNELNELKEITRNIEKEIEKIINEEEIERLKKSKFDINNDNYISKEFSGNKGNLLWPVENGIIISYFGEHKHPIFSGIIVKNNGIDFSTECNSKIYSVFNGVVSKVFAIKGANFAVIIRHGNYLTVYQNLKKVNVKIGEKVTKKQIIGYSYCENNSNIANLHFEIWQELKKQDPIEWIRNK